MNNYSSNQIKIKTALITGTTSGTGLATNCLFAKIKFNSLPGEETMIEYSLNFVVSRLREKI